MTDIKQREDKIKEKRMKTDFRDFVKHIASRQPLVFYKYKGLISRFPDTERVGDVIKYDAFYEQDGDLYTKGMDYDFGINFFDNFQKIFRGISLINMINFFMSENCDYSDVVSKGKNIYLSIHAVNGDENTMYSFGVKDECVNILNSCVVSDHSENVYLSSGVVHSFNIFYSRFIINSSNVWFSTNLIGCHDCVDCNNLENTSYCIHNKQYTKEEFLTQREKILREKNSFLQKYSKLNAQSVNYASQSVSGAFLVESENVEDGYFTQGIQTGHNIINVGGFEGCQNIYDVVDGGGPSLSNLYGINGVAINAENCFMSCHVPNCSSVYYSYYLESCSYCIGCVGLKNKQFHIFNKEYTKKERYDLANKIFAQMESDGILGQFFPGAMNPFYFNDTVAHLVDDSFTKEEVNKEGYLRREEEIKTDIPPGSDVIKTKDLNSYQYYDAQGNWTINPDILKKVIIDEKGNYYRIVKMEYDFLVKHGLPLPELHRLERIKLGFKFK